MPPITNSTFDRTKLRVLIVDDHSMTREMVRLIIKGLGFTNICTAENGLEAQQQINDGFIDLVICDWNMPRFSGLELLQSIRAKDKFKDLPFLMLTAEAYRDSIKEAMKAGVSDYIAKPFTAAILEEKIEKILKARAAEFSTKLETDN